MSIVGVDLQLKEYISKSNNGNTVVLNQQAPEVIAQELQLKERLENGFKDENDLLYFTQTYLQHTNHLTHPHYYGHQVAVPQELSGIPELIHGTINNPSSLYEMGPAGGTLEGFMINWMLDKVGWLQGKDYYNFKFESGSSSGLLTHGGSVANLTALAAARAKAAPDAWQYGNPKNLVVMGAATAHYSIARALSLLGMGSEAFVPVPVDENEVMQAEYLENIYDDLKSKNKQVMCVVANACATSTGLFDPIESIGDFCQKHQLWFHVDGAHGAAALAGEKYTHLLKGIDKASSIIWDAHKMMRVPALCTAVLFRDFKDQAGAFQQKGSYVFHDDEVVGMDSMPYTVECTKSALGTKLFWAFALEGQKAIGHYVDNSFQLTQEFYEFLQNENGFETPYTPQSNILCFRYTADNSTDAFQKQLRYQIINDKKHYLTSCIMNGKRYLRVVLMNPSTTLDHLKALIATIRSTSKSLSQGF